MKRLYRISILIIFIFLLLSQVYTEEENEEDDGKVADLWIEDYEPDPEYHQSQDICKDNHECTINIKYCFDIEKKQNGKLSTECKKKFFLPCEAVDLECLNERDSLYTQYKKEEEEYQKMVASCQIEEKIPSYESTIFTRRYKRAKTGNGTPLKRGNILKVNEIPNDQMCQRLIE